MSFPVHAITLDLDDTIWPIGPVIGRAEIALGAWLGENAPRTAERWPLAAMRALRDEVAAEHPQLAHDFTRQRMIALERMLHSAGDDIALAAPAFDAFFAARCEVVHYDDSLPALERMAARAPLAALSNGNADLHRIGL
ncbi:MAG TPA: HAD family hydrolase, partial [Lysobacter sp.]